ncbi:MAG TPA: CBS domain-containing protein [Myxococcaceae bacterium]|nr:CBS domain-containing protein [Myxococcaceae bacterium]
MRVEDVMTKQLETCRADDSLWLAARKMWEHDVGCLPVLGSDGRVTSVITDRDIAMAAYLRGKTLGEVKVSEAMSHRLVTVEPTDVLRVAEDRMRSEQVHRIPVVDALGFLKGMVTLNDLVHHLRTLKSLEGIEPAEIAGTLAAISSPRSVPTGHAQA